MRRLIESETGEDDAARLKWSQPMARLQRRRSISSAVRRAPQPLLVEAMPQAVTLDLGRTAILVIDMQNDFCHPEGWSAHIGVDVTPARAPIPALSKALPALRERSVPVVCG